MKNTYEIVFVFFAVGSVRSCVAGEELFFGRMTMNILNFRVYNL